MMEQSALQFSNSVCLRGSSKGYLRSLKYETQGCAVGSRDFWSELHLSTMSFAWNKIASKDLKSHTQLPTFLFFLLTQSDLVPTGYLEVGAQGE